MACKRDRDTNLSSRVRNSMNERENTPTAGSDRSITSEARNKTTFCSTASNIVMIYSGRYLDKTVVNTK